MSYRSWKQRQECLFGKLLLRKILNMYLPNKIDLRNIQYNQFGKPYIDNCKIDFNISHSGDYIVCAFANEMKIGVDIEKKREIDLNYYKEAMSNAENVYINKSENSIDSFLKIWTCKESILKAEGIGLNYPLDKINICVNSNIIIFNNNIWYINYINIDPQYYLCLAYNKRNMSLAIEYVTIKDMCDVFVE